MKRKELFGITDTIETIVRDKNGNIKSRRIINNSLWDRILRKLGLKHNSMTNDGFAQNAAWILKDIDADHSTYVNCDWISIGTGTTAADPADHQLETPKGIRQAGTGTRITTTVTNDTAQLVATFSQAIDETLTGTDNITEIGMFWHVSNDHAMLLRQVYSPADVCNWDQGDSLQVTVKVQCKQGA